MTITPEQLQEMKDILEKLVRGDDNPAGVCNDEWGNTCIYCLENESFQQPIHLPDCPIVRGRTLLATLEGT